MSFRKSMRFAFGTSSKVSAYGYVSPGAIFTIN